VEGAFSTPNADEISLGPDSATYLTAPFNNGT